MKPSDSDFPKRPTTYRAHPAYMERENAAMRRAAIVGGPGCWGSRWFHGSVCFERFTGDVEPAIVPDGQWRLVIWQPLTRTDRPRGWWRGTRGMSIGMTGYAPLPSSGDPLALWSKHPLRHLKTWRRSGWSIREIGYDEWAEGYSRSTQDRLLQAMFNAVLRSKIRNHPGNVRIYGAAPSPTARIEAGFANVDVPETDESLHTFSFICEPAKPAMAGTGLMEHWYRLAQERGRKWMDFGIFWRKGDPSSWKGYSRFKAQFGTRMVEYPTPLMRFTRGR